MNGSPPTSYSRSSSTSYSRSPSTSYSRSPIRAPASSPNRSVEVLSDSVHAIRSATRRVERFQEKLEDLYQQLRPDMAQNPFQSHRFLVTFTPLMFTDPELFNTPELLEELTLGMFDSLTPLGLLVVNDLLDQYSF